MTWIKCSDRLPEEHVCASVFSGADTSPWLAASRVDSNWISDEYQYVNGVHQSELPDPPKEDA